MEKQIRNIIKLVRDYDKYSTGEFENKLYSAIAMQIDDVKSELSEVKR